MTFLEIYEKLDINLGTDCYGDCLTIKSGKPVKFFDISENFNLIEKLKLEDIEEEKKVLYFLNKYQMVYFIPLQLPDNSIYGFVLKSVNSKNFYNYRINKNFPLVFGLEDFSDYRYNDLILLCEGIKDVQMLKLVYKYSLAYLTSQPSKSLWNYLTQITNKIIIIPDKDEAGKNFIDLDKKYKDNKYSKIDKYYCQSGKKDFGEYWELNDYRKRQCFVDEIKSLLKMKGIECQH